MHQYRVPLPPLPPLPSSLPALPQYQQNSMPLQNFFAHSNGSSTYNPTSLQSAPAGATSLGASQSASVNAQGKSTMRPLTQTPQLLFSPLGARLAAGQPSTSSSSTNSPKNHMDASFSSDSRDAVTSRWSTAPNENTNSINECYLPLRPSQNAPAPGLSTIKNKNNKNGSSVSSILPFSKLSPNQSSINYQPPPPPLLPTNSAMKTTEIRLLVNPQSRQQRGENQQSIESFNSGQNIETVTPITNLSDSDPYGILGLVNLLRQNESETNLPVLGIELSSLGLGFSETPLHKTFVSPYADVPQQLLGMASIVPKNATTPHYYHVPMSSTVAQRLALLSDEALLYIFYSMPRDKIQLSAATELFSRSWRFHKGMRLWVAKDHAFRSVSKTVHSERGNFLVFDVSVWEKARRDITIMYEDLEENQTELQLLQQQHDHYHNQKLTLPQRPYSFSMPTAPPVSFSNNSNIHLLTNPSRTANSSVSTTQGIMYQNNSQNPLAN